MFIIIISYNCRRWFGFGRLFLLGWNLGVAGVGIQGYRFQSAGISAGAAGKHSCLASPCTVGFYTAWQLASKNTCPKNKPGANCIAFYDRALEVPLVSLLHEVVTKLHTDSKGKRYRLHLLAEMIRSYFQKSRWDRRYSYGCLQVI